MNRSLVSIMLAAFMLWSATASSALAAVISTQDFIAGQERAALVDEIQRELAREDVRDAMVRLGVDPDQAMLRVDSLSDAELAQLDGELESLPAGGDVLALIGAVFVVLLILELVGVTNIFGGA